jgi:hypothetical protein
MFRRVHYAMLGRPTVANALDRLAGAFVCCNKRQLATWECLIAHNQNGYDGGEARYTL